jgi:hypothetical protein
MLASLHASRQELSQTPLFNMAGGRFLAKNLEAAFIDFKN